MQTFIALLGLFFATHSNLGASNAHAFDGRAERTRLCNGISTLTTYVVNNGVWVIQSQKRNEQIFYHCDQSNTDHNKIRTCASFFRQAFRVSESGAPVRHQEFFAIPQLGSNQLIDASDSMITCMNSYRNEEGVLSCYQASLVNNVLNIDNFRRCLR